MTRKEYNNGVKLWADDVYRYSVHCCSDSETAKDGVQEAFAALWEHRDTVSTDKGKSFLMSVVHNWAMSLHRHEKIHQENAFDLMGETTAQPDTSFDLREALQIAAARLPEIQRSALLLKDMEGFSCREIAEILNLSENQVTVYLFRARVSMKKTLIALGYDNNK
ncbi:MAG: sigma-70 family RNA polymerase sigma factor [Bacteroidales bacterium]|nr:sigma-70 family RNA polymerase sigma factor [Bacteroidales bacterium]